MIYTYVWLSDSIYSPEHNVNEINPLCINAVWLSSYSEAIQGKNIIHILYMSPVAA